MKKTKIIFLLFAWTCCCAFTPASYHYKQNLTVSGGAGGVSSGAILSLTLETRDLVTAGNLQKNRKDLRLAYNGTEIDYLLLATNKLIFKAQQSIGANLTDTGYSLYYGNSSESSGNLWNPANVYSFYSNGTSTTQYSVAGTQPSYVNFPKPNFLKHGSNPVLARSPGTGDYKNIRDTYTLFYENGWWYCFYDGNDAGVYDGKVGWGVYLAKSQDLKTWTKLGAVLQPSAAGQDSGSASAANVYKFGSTYYMYYMGCTGLTNQVPATPYVGMLATASNIEGPYTKQGVDMPLGGEGTYDDICALPMSVWYDSNDNLYKTLYSAQSSTGGRGIGYAERSAPTGTWSNRQLILGGDEQCENPSLIYDSSSSKWLLFCNHIQYSDVGEYTDSEVLYWSSDPTTWDIANKTLSLGPTNGAWDGYVIGLFSNITVQNGEAFVAYDGRTVPFEGDSTGGHEYRDGGIAESAWPLPWGNILSVPGSSSLTSSTTFGDGVVKIRAKLGDTSSVVGVSDGSNSYLFKYGGTYLQTGVNGSYTNSAFRRILSSSIIYEIQRSGSSVSFLINGVLVRSTTGSTGNMSVYLANNVKVEEVIFEPASFVSVSVGSLESIGPPVSNLKFGASAVSNLKFGASAASNLIS